MTEQLMNRFLTARRNYIAGQFSNLNPMQQQAALTTEGPLLLLAGAGSGKTRVLTSRIAYLVQEKAVDPSRILAITFTNKAANELKDRLGAFLGDEALDIWAGTFHSICSRILRRYGDRLGYSNHFTIYDTDDSKRVMKECQRLLNIAKNRGAPDNVTSILVLI